MPEVDRPQELPARLLTDAEMIEACAAQTNRPDVLGSAHDLSDWLDENPIA
ncbi:hypothetical protein ACIP2X_07380 [Streptomyces sp. NPDC089424]|uniref:hypothetical protein n=1 Tax=Streptomyces sp. NPDC089424 TaxID=3365917 RepID=UPI0037F8A19A